MIAVRMTLDVLSEKQLELMQTLFPLIKPVGKAIFWRTKQAILSLRICLALGTKQPIIFILCGWPDVFINEPFLLIESGLIFDSSLLTRILGGYHPCNEY